jgi:hypothetical protein
MKSLCPYMLFAVFFLNIPEGLAQDSYASARETYMEQAHNFSSIFSGRTAEPYPNIFTGSYYQYSRGFIEGSLYYKGQYYDRVELNINAQKDELHILSPDRSYAVVLDPVLVSGLRLGGERYTYYARDNQWKLPKGYYVILREAPFCLLKQVKKRYQERVDMTERVMHRSFEPEEYYYLIKDGLAYPLTGRKSLLAALGNHQRTLSRWISQRGLRIKDDAEGFYTQSVDCYISLLKQD